MIVTLTKRVLNTRVSIKPTIPREIEKKALIFVDKKTVQTGNKL